MIRFLMSKMRGSSIREMLVRLHRDERGAEGLEKLLIFAALVLPLLGILILYGNQLKQWLVDLWEKMTTKSNELSQDAL